MASSSSAKNWIVFFAAFSLTTGVAVAWLATVDLVDANIILTVRRSVQFAYPFLLLVMVARPLQVIFKKPWTAKVLRKRRLIGVAFAGVMTAHLALIAFRFSYSPELTYPIPKLLVGAGAYVMLYLMFITSFDGPTRAIGPKRWKILHRVGLVWAALIFGVPRTLEEIPTFDYLKLGVPMLFVLIVRFIAWRRSIQRDNSHSAA